MKPEKIKISKTCPHCGYEWIKRKNKPKSCPRCKFRLDVPKRRLK